MAAVADGSLRESPPPCDMLSSEEVNCGLLELQRTNSDSLSTAISTEENSIEQSDRYEKEALYRRISEDEGQRTHTMIAGLQQLYFDLEDSIEPFSITESTTMLKACTLILPMESPLMRRRAKVETQVDVQ